VPGNHDAYVRGSLPDLARTFAPWTTARRAMAINSLSAGPRRGCPDRFVVRCSDPLFIASGFLGKRQLQAAEETSHRNRPARSCPRRHAAPSAASHRLAPWARPCGCTRFEALIRRAGAELIIHGHNHKVSLTRMEGSRGLCRSSACPRRRSYAADRIIAPATIFSRFPAAGPIARSLPRERTFAGTAIVGDLGPLVL